MHVFTIRTVRSALIALAVALTLCAAASVGRAQEGGDPSNGTGLMLGIRSGAHGIGFEGDRDGTGTAFGLRAGYGFSERFTAFAGVDRLSVSDGDGFEGLPAGDSYHALYVDLGGRFHFRTDERLIPFAEVGASIVGLDFDNISGDETRYGGAAASLGAGLLWYAAPAVALEGAASLSAGRLMDREVAGVKDDVEISMSGLRVHVGLTFYPFQ